MAATEGEVVFLVSNVSADNIYSGGVTHTLTLSGAGWPQNDPYEITRATLQYSKDRVGYVPINYLIDGNTVLTDGSSWTGTVSLGLSNLTKSIYAGKTSLSLKIAGDGGNAGRIQGGSSIYLYVHWRLTAIASTFTIPDDTVTTGAAIPGTITTGTGITRHDLRVTLGSLDTGWAEDVAGLGDVTIPAAWAEDGLPNAETGLGMVYLRSYSGDGALIGENSRQVTVQVDPAAVPVISDPGFGYLDRIETEIGGTTYQDALQGLTRISYAPAAAGAQGSSIVMYRYTMADGSTFETTAAAYTTEAVNRSGSLTFRVEAQDSRGRTASATLTAEFLSYAEPVITRTEEYRCGSQGAAAEDGTYISAKAEYTWAQVQVTHGGATVNWNTLALKIEYLSGGAAATGYDGAADSAAHVIGGSLSAQSAYTVRYTLTDRRGNTRTQERNVPTGGIWMAWDPAGNAIGFGGYPGGSDRFYIDPARMTVYIGQQTLAEYIRSVVNNS